MKLRYILDRETLLLGGRLQTNWWRMIIILGASFGAAIFLPGLGTGLSYQLYRYMNYNPVLGSGFVILVCLAFGSSTSLFLWAVLLPMRVARMHRQNAFLYGEIEVSTDDEGIGFAAPRSHSRFSWTDLAGFKETRSLFLVIASKSYYMPIPKKQLSAEQTSSLRQTLLEHLKKCKHPFSKEAR